MTSIGGLSFGNEPGFETGWKRPADCSPKELSAFKSLVLAGGEVEPAGIDDRINRAERLVFCKSGVATVGVAALKKPSANYRRNTTEKSGFDLTEQEWPVEFGWVFVCPGARGHRISDRLLGCGLDRVDYGVFATSRADNPWIHAPLQRAGFVRAGNVYISDRHGGDMVVFYRAKQ